MPKQVSEPEPITPGDLSVTKNTSTRKRHHANKQSTASWVFSGFTSLLTAAVGGTNPPASDNRQKDTSEKGMQLTTFH